MKNSLRSGLYIAFVLWIGFPVFVSLSVSFTAYLYGYTVWPCMGLYAMTLGLVYTATRNIMNVHIDEGV